METMKNQRTPRGGGRKNEFTTVDAVVILLVLMTVIGAVIGWVYQATTDRDDALQATYIVTFRICETHRVVIDGLTVGDAVYVMEDGSLLGYLRDDLVVQNGSDDQNPDLGVTGVGSILCSGLLEGRSLELDDGRCLTPGNTLLLRTEREFLTVEILEITATGK